jgi:hypothetical protein
VNAGVSFQQVVKQNDDMSVQETKVNQGQRNGY